MYRVALRIALGMVVAAGLSSCKKEAGPQSSEVATQASVAGSVTPPQTAPTPPSPKDAKVAALTTLQDFVAAASDANIKLAESTIYREDTDPNHLLGRPGQYLAKMSWKIDGEDATIEVFGDLVEAKARKAYVDAIGKSTPMFLQYSFLSERRLAVLRLPKELTPTNAQTWDTLLQKL